eukprot:467330-Alexandrium_andersonii.AAC.1
MALAANRPVSGAHSDSSDDPPVAPLNLPTDGTAPVFTGEPTDQSSPPQVDQPGSPAEEAGQSQSKYGTPR